MSRTQDRQLVMTAEQVNQRIEMGDRVAAHAFTGEVVGVIEARNGRYDGWGGTVVD